MDLDNSPLWLAGLAVLGLIAGVIALLVFAPLITIWALNLLFGLQIPMAFETWAASLWLGWLVSGGLRTSSNKKD